MKPLVKPTQKAKEVLALCTANIQDEELKVKLDAVADAVEAGETLYDIRGSHAELYRLKGTEGVGASVSTKEMVSLYDNKLSKKRERARKIYNEIKISSKHNICPLCAHRDVGTLDHYLAKTIHPLFAITPINLLPSCIQCNKTKSTHQPADAANQTLHPYFDNIDHDQWLTAQVVEKSPPGILFFASPPNDWPETLRERVVKHFSFFGLEELYGTNAARRLENMRGYLCAMAAKFDDNNAAANSVRLHLEAQAASCFAAGINSWETAMFEALAASEWFYTDGYKGIVI